MKKILLYCIIPLSTSCQQSQKIDLIHHLANKIWVSKTYIDVLNTSNSVFDAENSSSHDQSLVFKFSTQKAMDYYDPPKKIQGYVMSTYNPHWMEERSYILKQDSTVVDFHEDKVLFKISKIINDTLIVTFPNHKQKKFISSKNTPIYEGLKNINLAWFSGKYKFEKKGTKGHLIFHKDGTLSNASEILNTYDSYTIYACKGCENGDFSFLVLSDSDDYLNNSLFIIEKGAKNNGKIVLSETHPIEDSDDPIIKNGKKIILQKEGSNDNMEVKSLIRYVTAKSGLRVREHPSLSAKKIGQLNYSEKIEIKEKTGRPISIKDEGKTIEGTWVKISSFEQKKLSGYVFDGFLSHKKILPNLKEWSNNDFIIQCPKNYEAELRQDIAYQREQWKNTPNPILATYKGNYIGDYHHIGFEDVNKRIYDFGFGQNDFGDIELFDQKEFNDHPAYVGKSFKIFWEWRVSTFPCCSGEYEMVKAYQPSIVKLEIIEN